MIELLKDYGFTLQYHPGKANVVTNALSQKSYGMLASLMIREWRELKIFTDFDIQIAASGEG